RRVVPQGDDVVGGGEAEDAVDGRQVIDDAPGLAQAVVGDRPEAVDHDAARLVVGVQVGDQRRRERARVLQDQGAGTAGIDDGDAARRRCRVAVAEVHDVGVQARAAVDRDAGGRVGGGVQGADGDRLAVVAGVDYERRARVAELGVFEGVVAGADGGDARL